MASVDPVPSVSALTLSSALPHVRVDPDREKPHHHEEPKEELKDKLELHEDEAEEPIVLTVAPVLLDYDGLDLSA